MKKIVLLTVLLALLVTLSSASAVTRNGRSTPGGTQTWQVFHGPGGMLIITVYWKTRNATLFLIGVCDDGASFVSGSQEDRFNQVVIEVDPGTTCQVQAPSRGGSSRYWINIRGSGIFSAPAQNGLTVTRSNDPAPLLDELAKLGKARAQR